MKCDACGNESSEASLFCPRCGSPLNAGATDAEASASYDQPPISVDSAPPRKKKSRLGLILLTALIGVLVIVLIAGLCTNWFGFYGPAAQIASAANNTLNAGSLTMEIKSQTTIFGNTLTLDGTVEVMLAPEDRDLKLYATMHVDNQPLLIVIYNNYLITNTISGHQYQKQNISGELDKFFDRFDKDRELDWEELLNGIRDGLYDEVSEVIAFDALEKCLSQYYRNLNNNKWLQENAGYSLIKENGVKHYQFKPRSYKFLDTSLEYFKDAFTDEDMYSELVTGLKNTEEELNKFDVAFAIGVEKRKLSSVQLELEYEFISTAIELAFKNIGETTIDENALQRISLKHSLNAHKRP